MNKSVEKLLNNLKERNVKLYLTTVYHRIYESICTKLYRIVQNLWKACIELYKNNLKTFAEAILDISDPETRLLLAYQIQNKNEYMSASHTFHQGITILPF